MFYFCTDMSVIYYLFMFDHWTPQALPQEISLADSVIYLSLSFKFKLTEF